MAYRELQLPDGLSGIREWRQMDGRWRVLWLGRVGYSEALDWQEAIVAAKAKETEAEDVLLLLEHEPVYTIGRSPDRSSLGDVEASGVPVVEVNRGGKATYHGPGQLVGYPLFDLRRGGKDLHRYLRSIEMGLSEAALAFGVEAGFREGLTGVWVGNRKLASIGVGVRRWVAMHGFALNVNNNIEDFQHIIPCGISEKAVTSLSNELGYNVDIQEVAERCREAFARGFS